jgi:GNAT superfamily N-acetyltransferase
MIYTTRELYLPELYKLEALGNQFATESKWVKFNIDSFIRHWETFLMSAVGMIFVAETEDGDIVGAIGGLKFEEPNSGTLMANELFWIVHPDHRGNCGLTLLNRLEDWARESGCACLWMNYLTDSMPEKVKSIYERKGFVMAETHWVKEM